MDRGFDVERYRNDGWGLSVAALAALADVIDDLPAVRAIEFGSGGSTRFLVDYCGHADKPLTLDSFDNDARYGHPDATLARLVQCGADDYERMFERGEIDWSAFRRRWRRPKSRQKRCFYDLSDVALAERYDVAVVDGPHGNGRNFAWLLLRGRMSEGACILIDDFNHYDFLERAASQLPLEEVRRVESATDNFVLVRVTAPERAPPPVTAPV